MPAFLAPAWFLLLPPLWGLLYWLHRRRPPPPEVPVSSLAFWAVETKAARRPRWVSLQGWVEGLLVALLVAVLAGPSWPERGPALPPAVLVDRRAGMGARHPQAKDRLAYGLAALARWLGPEEALELLTVPDRGLPRRVPRAALRTLSPAPQGGDFEAALAGLLALPGPRAVVTDEEPRPEFPELAWLGCGAPGRNLGLIFVHWEPRREVLHVGVLNGGTVPARGSLRLEGAAAPLARFRLRPGAVWTGSFRRSLLGPLPWRLRLPGGDDLAADDAVTVRTLGGGEVGIAAGASVPAPVLRALRALGWEPRWTSRRAARLFWRLWPAGPVAGPALVVVPAKGTWGGVRVAGTLGPAVPLLRGPARPWAPRRVLAARRLAAEPAWEVLLRAAGGEPLVLRREGVVVLAFDPVGEAPAWSRRPAFPLFFHQVFGRAEPQVMGLLSAAATRLGTRPGRAAPLRLRTTTQIRSARSGLLVAAFALWMLLVFLEERLS